MVLERVRPVVVLVLFLSAACGSSVQQQPLEEPCAGKLNVRHAYSECQADGFWHVVENHHYTCPPDNNIRIFRVGDTPTDQPCANGEPAPAIAGGHFRQLAGDETCQSPVVIGELVISECVDGIWEQAAYRLYQCLDRGVRIDIPAVRRTRTTTPCNAAPPAP
ncbi:MAG TPA: hypothetical protein VHK90_04370 [Thermoanaerobaculia bacterium]|nr:hypothetical protein [Thermoanaerobaculia bacterium]